MPKHATVDRDPRVLVVATKTPWPPVDGGRLVLLETLRALADRGCRPVLVTPVENGERSRMVRDALADVCDCELVVTRPRSVVAAILRSAVTGRPFTAERHRLGQVARRVAEVAGRRTFDVVHAEQAQSVPQACAAALPIVVRAHNVEGRLWRHAASTRGWPLRTALRREGGRVDRWEGRTLAAAAEIVAITAVDVDDLARAVAGRVPVATVPPAFPSRLPAGGERLEGRPAVVVLASHGWEPARAAVRTLARDWWPRVAERLPEARLHVFGPPTDGGTGVVHHPPPVDSRTAFADGAVAMVAARHPTGVPMKGLEAWARGLPVVASPGAAAALEAPGGDALLVADGSFELVAALTRLVEDPGLVQRLVAAGRRRLEDRHAPAVVAGALVTVYRRAAATSARTAPT